MKKVIVHNLDDTDEFRKSVWEMYARDRLRPGLFTFK
jgi:hypothetical protein